MEVQNNIQNNNPHKNKVHRILAHSYTIQLFLFLIGFGLDLFFKFKISTNPVMAPIGVSVLILGSFIILWAQKTTNNLKKVNIDKDAFYHGPYRYTRSPTHIGLFFLTLGFGIMINALLVALFATVAFIVSKFIFLNEQEKVLEQKYGSPYLEYKKMVRF